MIERVTAILERLGVLRGPLDPLDLSLMARFAGNTTVIVFTGREAFHVVKLGSWRPLGEEFALLARVHAALPGYVAPPLALEEIEGMDVMVVQGIPHRPLVGMPQGGEAGKCALALAGFLAEAQAAFAETGRDVPAEVRAAAARVAPRLPAGALQAWLDAHAGSLQSLTASTQHGDLSLTNIGLASNGVVVFDWEDFGHVHVAGFDLATLLLSTHEFDVDALERALARPRSFAARLMRAAGPRLGLDGERLMALLPAYLASFIDLKTRQGYAPYVQELALGALRASLAR